MTDTPDPTAFRASVAELLEHDDELRRDVDDLAALAVKVQTRVQDAAAGRPRHVGHPAADAANRELQHLVGAACSVVSAVDRLRDATDQTLAAKPLREFADRQPTPAA